MIDHENLIKTIHCETFTDFINKVQSHTKNGYKVASADAPSNMTIGFVCLETFQLWTCKLNQIKKDIEKMPDNFRKKYRNIFMKITTRTDFMNNKL